MSDWTGIVGKSFTAETFVTYVAGLSFPAWRPQFVVVHNTGDPTLADILEVGITGGSLSFVFDAPSSQLLVSTTFMLARTLTAAEIEVLRDFTSGQWSDGIGDNFFQERMSHGLAPHAVPMDDEDIHITQGS